MKFDNARRLETSKNVCGSLYSWSARIKRHWVVFIVVPIGWATIMGKSSSTRSIHMCYCLEIAGHWLGDMEHSYSDNMDVPKKQLLTMLRDSCISLSTYVSSSTRRRSTDQPTLLDLLLINEEAMVKYLNHGSPLGKGDHCVLNCKFLEHIHLQVTLLVFNHFF